MAIAQYLRDCGYKVVEAVDADEAMAVLSHLEARTDVVLSDIELPGAVDGFGLSKWIREHRPEIQVVLTGTVLRAVSAAHDLCEEGPLAKPYEPQAGTRPHTEIACLEEEGVIAARLVSAEPAGLAWAKTRLSLAFLLRARSRP